MSGCGCGTWVGGNSPNVWLEDPALDENKMTQSDLRFCENDTSERCKNNENGVNKIINQGENWYKIYASKWSNDRFGLKK